MPSSQNLSIYGTVVVVEGIISSILKKTEKEKKSKTTCLVYCDSKTNIIENFMTLTALKLLKI